MDTPSAYWLIVLHDPTLRGAVMANTTRARRRHHPQTALAAGSVVRRGLAQALRALAARLDPALPTVATPTASAAMARLTSS
jgi:hypothetical protein